MENPHVLFLELAIVTVLIVVNGLLSMSELAIVSSRPARLAALVEKGISGSRRALALASDPGKFLSTVQIGITLIGVLSGAFSGATLGQRLSQWLLELGVATELCRCHWRRGRRHRHHLCVADRRRTGAEADRAARSRSDRREGCTRHGLVGKDLAAAGVAARSFRQGAAVAARTPRRGRGQGQRGRDQDPGRGGRKCRRARARRKGDDRGRDAAWRSAGRRGDDAKAGRQLDRSCRYSGGDIRHAAQDQLLARRGIRRKTASTPSASCRPRRCSTPICPAGRRTSAR